MSYNSFFSLKSDTSNIVASFASTDDETYILLIANDVETITQEGSEETVRHSNAILIGANTLDETTDEHELSIIVRNYDNSITTDNKIAQFNNQNIILNRETLLENDILPNNANINIGSETNKWGSIFAENIIVDGSDITNINLNDKSTDDLKETVTNRYYKKQYFFYL